MHHILFIPGIMGSKLERSAKDGSTEEVWPPTVWEVIRGYQRIDALLDPQVRSSAVLEKQCEAFYGPLLDAIRASGANEQGAKDRLIPWHYDWRKDLTLHARRLASDLTAICAVDPNPRISIIAHSMGGLVARGCIESPENAQAAWLGRIGLALFLATPHNGAPLALSRILGIGGSSVGLSQEQLRQLSNHPDYPSAYQLLPPQDDQLIWRLDGLLPFSGQSVAQLVADPAQKLNAASLALAHAFRQRLDATRRPSTMRYFAIASASHSTNTRFDAKGASVSGVAPKNCGDGTVPVHSAASLDVQTGYVVADHVGVAKSDQSIDLALMLLGLKPVEPSPLGFAQRPAKTTLSVSPMIPAADEDWEIVLAFASGVDGFDGTIEVQPISVAGVSAAAPMTIAVRAQAPALETLALAGPRLSPGQYRLILRDGEAEIDKTALIVSASLGETRV